jgi:hypothetical protein
MSGTFSFRMIAPVVIFRILVVAIECSSVLIEAFDCGDFQCNRY